MKFVSMNLIFSNFSENVSEICSPRMRREAVRERRKEKKMQLRFFFFRSENKKKWLIKEIAFLDGFFVLRWNEKFLWILFVTPFRSFLDFDFDNFLCICIWYEYEYELVYGLCYCYLRVCLFEFFCTEGVTRKRGVHEWEGSTWDPVIEAKTWKPRLSHFFVSLSS
jgi:hypothetical protein